MTEDKVEVLIVGAGPTGLTAACCLARLNIPFRIIDKAPEPSTHSKALGVQPRTLELMEDLELEQPFLQEGVRLNGLKFFIQKKQIASIELSDFLESAFNYVTIFPQSQTEHVLIEDLKRREIEVERELELVGFEQEDGIVSAHMSSGEVISANWLIGADGARSTVRHQLGIEFPGSSMEHIFALADVETANLSDQKHVLFYFHKDGPILFFPLGKNKVRVVVSLRSTEKKSFTQKDFEELLLKRAKMNLQIQKVLWISSFRISHRLAPVIQEQNCFLLGDAFHIHSPIGGQGMNTGIQDAYNLCWKLALVIKNKSPASILDSYTEERLPNAELLLRITNRMTQLADSSSIFSRFFRRFFMKLIFKNPKTARLIANQMGQLSIHYTKSSIITDDWKSKSHNARCPKAGDLLADYVLASYDSNQRTSLFQITRGFKYDLLIFFSKNPSEESLQEISWLSEFIDQHLSEEIQIHNILTDDEIHPKILKKRIRWVDPERKLHERWGLNKPALVLVRPDKYIAYRSQPINHILLENYLRRVFQISE